MEKIQKKCKHREGKISNDTAMCAKCVTSNKSAAKKLNNNMYLVDFYLEYTVNDDWNTNRTDNITTLIR